MRRLALTLAALLCCAASAAWAMGQRAGAELDDYGRYAELTRDPYGFESASIAGYSSVVRTELLERTTRVPLRLGELFGFNYAIRDAAAVDDWIPVRIEISHPTATDYRGRPSNSFVIDSAAQLHPDGRYRNGAFYRLSETRELLPGRWRISVIYRGETLVSQEFLIAADMPSR